MHEAPAQISRKLEQTPQTHRRHPRPGATPGPQHELADAAEAEDGAEERVGPEDGEIAVGGRFDGALGGDGCAGLVGGHGGGGTGRRGEVRCAMPGRRCFLFEGRGDMGMDLGTKVGWRMEPRLDARCLSLGAAFGSS